MAEAYIVMLWCWVSPIQPYNQPPAGVIKHFLSALIFDLPMFPCSRPFLLPLSDALLTITSQVDLLVLLLLVLQLLQLLLLLPLSFFTST